MQRMPSDSWLVGVAVIALVGVLILSTQLARRVATQNRAAPPVSKPATDAAVVGYREGQAVTLGCNATALGAIDTNGCAGGDKQVINFEYLSNGNPLLDKGNIPDTPTALTMAPHSEVYFALRNRIEMQRVAYKVRAWTLPEKNAYITSLSVSGKTLWVADAGNRTVWRYTTDGKRLNAVVKGLVVPSPHLDVAALPDGTVWVTNPGKHRLEHYAADGTLLGSWTKPLTGLEGFSGCCNPADIAVLPDGRIVTSEKGAPRVKVYKADGTFDCVVAGPECFTDTGAHDVAVDARGRIYVLDRSTVRVFVRK
jgi:hypothetical protein